MSEDLTTYLDDTEQKLNDLEKTIIDLFNPTLLEKKDDISILDQCQVDVLLVFAANNLLLSYLSTQGVSMADHPLQVEMKRVLEYIKKIKVAHGSDKAAVKVTVPAAGRFIKHALAGNDTVESNKKAKTE